MRLSGISESLGLLSFMTKSTQGSYKANLIRYDCSGQSAAQSVIVRLRTLRDFGEFEMAYSCARFSLCYNHW